MVVAGASGWNVQFRALVVPAYGTFSKICSRGLHSSRSYQALCEDVQLDSELRDLFRNDEHGNAPTVKTYRILLKRCAKRKALADAKRVYNHLAKQGLELASSLGEFLVTTLVKCGGLQDALQLFYRLPHRTVFSWSAIIDGYTMCGQGQDALNMYQLMQQEHVEPNTYTFVSLLKACSMLRDLDKGKQIHAEIVRLGYETDLFVGTCLIDMYGKCGSIEDAQNVFSELPQRDVMSWNAIIAAYAEKKQAQEAFKIYIRMQDEGVYPDSRTFVSILQACCTLAEREQSLMVNGRLIKSKSLEKAQSIHVDVRTYGCDSDMFVASTLISVYGKCGSIEDAQKVFDGLSQRDVVVWNVMMGAFVEQGEAEVALQLYEEMQKNSLRPTNRTIVTALQACGMLQHVEEDNTWDANFRKSMFLKRVRAIHADARRKGYDADNFVGTSLIGLYGKLGRMEDVESVFQQLIKRDAVVWTAKLAAYVEHGEGEKALQFYRLMQEECLSPDVRTFVSILQACSLLAENDTANMVNGRPIMAECLKLGKELHAYAWRKGYSSDSFVSNALVTLYGRCGSIPDAEVVFDGLLQGNVVSWTAMLAVFVEQGQAVMAVELYRRMLEEGVSPNSRTFVSLLQACGILAEQEEVVLVHGQATKSEVLKQVKCIHAEAQGRSFNLDAFVAHTLVSLYGKCGSVVDAEIVFEGLHNRNIVSWNAMLSAYNDHDRADMALHLYEQMQLESVSPDVRTTVGALQACATRAEKEVRSTLDGEAIKAEYLKVGKAIHAYAHSKGFDSDVFVGCSLISMYGKCGILGDAENVFNESSVRNVVSWTAMLTAYVELGQAQKALDLYGQMQEEGVSPNNWTFVSILQACSKTGSLDVVSQIHDNLSSCDYDVPPFLARAMIDAFGRCASMSSAQSVFNALHGPSVACWNALIAGYARVGDSFATMQKFDEMQQAGIKPDGVTFLSVLCACGHAGLVDRGVEYFASMTQDYNITPGIDHYAAMVDLLGRAGYFKQVEDLVSLMPMQPDLAIMLCLLGACRKHGNVALGEHAFQCAVRLEPSSASAYVMMLNIYADAGIWDRARKVLAMEQAAGASKKPGQCWIQTEQEVHNFLVGDCRQSQGPLNDMLREMTLEIKSVPPHVNHTSNSNFLCRRLPPIAGSHERHVKSDDQERASTREPHSEF